MSHANTKLNVARWLLVFASSIFGFSTWASSPQSFTYQGELLDNLGDPSTETISVRFQILNEAGDCILYEEEQTGVDLSLTAGFFALSVGGPLASPKRTGNDQALEMHDIFSNAPAEKLTIGTANCTSGYTPASGEKRRLRVTIIGVGGTDTLSPDQMIDSVPFALNSFSLQGMTPTDFVRHTVTDMQTLVEDLVNGTSNLYLRADGTNAANVPLNNNRLVGVANPVNPQDASTKDYSDKNVGGRAVDNGTAPTAGQVLVWNVTNSRWEPANPSDNTVMAHARATASTCVANEASKWNGTTWDCVALPSGGGGGGGGSISTGTFNTLNLTAGGPKTIAANYSEGLSLVLPDATTVGTGGPIFSVFNDNSNNQLIIPIFDISGNFITGINYGQQKNIYNFDDSSANGNWRTNDMNQNWGHIRVLPEPSGATDSVTNTKFVLLPGTSTYLLVYTRDGSSYARALTVNTTSYTVNWGGEVNVGAYNNFELVAVNSGQALFYSNGGSYEAIMLNVSGTSTTVGTVNSGFSHCYGFRRLSDSVVSCQPSGSCSTKNINKLAISGNTVTSSSLSISTGGSCGNNWEVSRLDDSQAIVTFGASDGLKAAHINVGSWTVGAVLDVEPGASHSSSSIGQGVGRSFIKAVSATEFVFATSDNNSCTRPTRAYRVTVTGTTLAVADSVDIGSPSCSGTEVYFFTMGGTNYIRYEENGGASSERLRVVNDFATLNFGSPIQSGNYCWQGHRYASGRCLSGETNSGYTDGVVRATVSFKAGD
ncbi:MAG: hypothetical protein HRT45_08345 [Bdellovibrionales bacterium]|nr:hypothetical protein [Bdellovibrionales bacterium]